MVARPWFSGVTVDDPAFVERRRHDLVTLRSAGWEDVLAATGRSSRGSMTLLRGSDQRVLR
jgi:hypothetical protein